MSNHKKRSSEEKLLDNADKVFKHGNKRDPEKERLKNHKSNPGSCPHSLLKEEKQKIIEYALENPDVRQLMEK